MSGALISVDRGTCRQCLRCARVCPVHAIGVDADGALRVLEERCIGCGLCVEECPHGAFAVREGGSTVDALLGAERPVIALLAPEYVAALHPRTPAEVERALVDAGFHAVETTLLGDEAVALAYEQRHAVRNGLPVIRSTCPVVAEFVRRYHPALAGALAPIVPPYIAQARLIRQAYEAPVAIVYVAPCYARKDEAASAPLAGEVDAVIDFRELEAALGRMGSEPGEAEEPGTPRPVKELSLTDGFPRSTLESRDLTSGDLKVVRGLHELGELLSAIESGVAAPLVVDALNCEGCLDGPAVSPGLSLFVKRDIESTDRRRRSRAPVSSRDVLRRLPALDLRRTFEPAPVSTPRPDERLVIASLAEAGLGEAALDCGACGWDRCADLAAAVVREETTWRACAPRERLRLESEIDQLGESAFLDPLTGLANRASFADRLREEFARRSRYGGAISLLMLDVDQFKGINDRYGHLHGDEVLAAVAGTMRSVLRVSDLAARYGGDEFAIVLPETSKTEAFAVAEKLRLAVEAEPVTPPRGGQAVEVRVSVGVASTSERVREGLELVEAADRALYQAKRNGRNQVRLAPG